jgi:hypothetical protein
MKRSVSLVALFAAVVALGATVPGCGLAPSAANTARVHAPRLSAEWNGQAPDPSEFVTIKAVVTQLLPDSDNPNNGLKHQNFIVQESSPQSGLALTVNNDITVGQRVAGLAVGEALTIRGITYQDPGKNGIHWTHHTNRPGDGGFIQTPDGHVYQ